MFGFFYLGHNNARKEMYMIYNEWLLEWLVSYEKPSRKSRTYTKYKDIVEKRLIPRFGEYELWQITPLQVQRYIAELTESGNQKTGEGLSSNSINSIISVIQKSMNTAYLVGYVDTYDMNKIKRPKTEESPVECFTLEEQRRIELAVMQDKRAKMKGIVLCLYTGLRIGELLALEWDDIDFQKGILSVTRSCHDGKDENGKYCRITEAPKTSKSRRDIPIPKQIIPMLKDMKKASATALVISDGMKIPSVRAYQGSFALFLKKHDIPHRGFHSLRHTFATRAIECGMDVKTLSEVLGHKNATVPLNRYVHSMMEHKKAMMNKLGKLF